MSITTYSELVTAVQNWASRNDSDFVARIPEFITLAEGRITYGSKDIQFPTARLRARQMEQRATATISDEFTELPTDYLEMIKVKLTTDPVTELQYLAPVNFDSLFVSSQTGQPVAFTVIGSELRVAPSPDTSYTAEMWYYKTIAALTSGNTTNWLLTAAPQIYLYGVLLEAAPYLDLGEDSQTLQVWYRAYASALSAFAEASTMSRYGGLLVQRTDTGNP